MLPDIDLLLGILDIQHRTLTHSIVFWSFVFAPVFLKYRKLVIPYFVAVIQHILLGDLIVGKTAILWPIADFRPGLGLPILSPIGLALEAVGLALMLVLVISSKRQVKKSPSLLVIAAVPLIAFVLLASLGEFLPPILLESSDAQYLERNLPTLENPALQFAVFLHIMLLALILFVFARDAKKNVRSEQT
jgi:membrane-bound metal-dependent hydrolase YbcI (DUF457 family)